MNLLKFKQYIIENKFFATSLPMFRNWVTEQYYQFSLFKNICFESEEEKYVDETSFYSEAYPELNLNWNTYSIYSAIGIYSKMGWELDDEIKKIKITKNEVIDELCYEYTLDRIYNKILTTCNDDVEFFYAVILLIDNIYENTEQGQFKESILQGLREYQLSDLAKIVPQSIKVFVAMSFASNMDEARTSIKRVLNNCGYKPILIDEKQHNNQIVEEIFNEISESEFVVADLTGQKGGVYLEVGYALAKGKSVILLCSAKEKKKIHFDVRQINTIFWEDKEDLEERLKNRIKVSIQKQKD